MSAGPGPSWAADDAFADDSSLAAVRDSDVLVDLLADRSEAVGAGADDPLAVVLAGWVRTIDAEVAAALPRGATVPSVPLGARPDGRVLPVRPSRHRGRGPWWALSAGAAAVITVLAVGVGVHDATRVAPAATVAESVQSVETTLAASFVAAQAGDVAGARVLLEQARALLDALPPDERARLDASFDDVEHGVRTAEDAVRQGLPVPDLGPLPVPGAGAGVPGPERPDRPGGATPDARPSAPGGPGSAPAADPGAGGRPDDAPRGGPGDTPGTPGDDPGAGPDDDPAAGPGGEPGDAPGGGPGGRPDPGPVDRPTSGPTPTPGTPTPATPTPSPTSTPTTPRTSDPAPTTPPPTATTTRRGGVTPTARPTATARPEDRGDGRPSAADGAAAGPGDRQQVGQGRTRAPGPPAGPQAP